MRGRTLSALVGALLCGACGGEGAHVAEAPVHPERGQSGVAAELAGGSVRIPPIESELLWFDLLFAPPPPSALAWTAALVSDSSAPGELEVRGVAGIRDRVAVVGRSAADVLIDGEPVLANLGPGNSFIIALDHEGRLAWARRSTIDFARATQSAGSDLLVAGTDEDGDLVVQQWGADGNLLREHRWSCHAEMVGLAAAADNGYVLAANLRRPCAPDGKYLDDGAMIVGFNRSGPGRLEFWKGMEVVDLDVASNGDALVARVDRAGNHALVRLGADGRIRWSVGLGPRRAVQVDVDPVGRTFLASDVDLTAWTARGRSKWGAAESGISSLAAGRGWVAHAGAGSLLSMVRGTSGEVLLDWSEPRLSAGPIAATADGDLIVSLSSVHEVAWENERPVARGSSGRPRVTIVRLKK